MAATRGSLSGKTHLRTAAEAAVTISAPQTPASPSISCSVSPARTA